ncbi:MAG TPA: MMPL family transporter [Thermoanaerobaculia bacterium]|nr:MMPL family transporter [Thermoanaerobaculia bacterium]
MKLSLLQRFALYARRRYRTVFAVSALLLAVSLVLTLRLSFDSDILNLLPRKEPAVKAYIEALEDFGSGTLLVVAIRIPEGVVAEPYESFTDALAARLARLQELKSVEHRIGDPEELLRTFFPKSVLFLDARGRSELAARLSDEGIRQRVSELRRQLSTPQGLAVKQLAKLDPLGLAQIFLGRVESSRGTLQVDWTSGYYLSRDHRMILILAEPARPPQNIKWNARLVGGVDKAVAETLADWGEIAGPGAPARPEVGLGGPHLTALGDTSMIRYDMVVNIVTSALGVLLLFLFAFRRPGALIYAFLPLVFGLILTFGFAKLTVGALSSATSVVAALLIGLGIDFVIVSYGRYIEERQRGGSLETALLAMSGSSGRAVLVGAVTTTATFYAFTFTDFVGLRQMGLFTGTGILFCAAAVFLLLPAMLAWSEDHHERRQTEPNLFLHSFGSDVLMRLCIRHRRVSLLIGGLITAVALATALQIRFDESMKTMRPQGNRGLDVMTEVGAKFGSGFNSMTLLLSGDSPEEVVALAAKAAEGARKLVHQGSLYGYSGVTSLIPPPDQQREVLDWLERERQGGLDLARIRATFAGAAAQQGLRVEPFEPGLDLLGRAIQLSGPVGVEDFRGSKQTQLLLDRFLKKTDRGGWRGAVYLNPAGNQWRREAPPDALRLAETLGPKAVLTGTNVVNQTVRREVLEDAWVAGILGFVLVALLLWLDFRTLRHTFMALAPLTVGILWMVGAMSAFGIQMNFINVFVTTMIIGIGVDYGVHVLHRYLEVRDFSDEEYERGMLETGKAVVAAALSTIVGFGSITFSHYPGLISTGKVAILGATCTSLIAITLLPTVLSWRREIRKKNQAAMPATADASSAGTSS